jgi:YbbR domain-containing protein
MIRTWLGNAGSAILAGILALMVWFVAINESNPLQEGAYPAGGIAIEAINMTPGLEIFGGLRDRAQVRLLAPRTFWESNPSSDFRVYVDLKDLEPGIHSVPVEILCAWCEENRVRIVSVTPKQIAVRLEERASRVVEVQMGIIGEAALGYNLQRPVVTPSHVTIKGPRSAIESVVQIQGAVVVNVARSSFDRVVSLYALDQSNQEVRGITIEPPQVTVRVPVEQEQGFRDLAVTVARDITPASGYWISNITVQPTTVTVNGPPTLIKSLPGSLQTQPITEQNVTESFERRVPLVVPDGVTIVGLSDPSVLVRVDVEVERSGRTVERVPQIRNLPPSYTATISPSRVQVILSGPIPELREVDPDTDMTVFVDLAGLTPGVHTLPVQVRVAPDTLQKRVVPESIEVTITAPIPTPSPTASPEPTPLSEPTPQE